MPNIEKMILFFHFQWVDNRKNDTHVNKILREKIQKDKGEITLLSNSKIVNKILVKKKVKGEVTLL